MKGKKLNYLELLIIKNEHLINQNQLTFFLFVAFN